MTTGVTVHDQNLDKQIDKHMGGCMAGFFNLNHLLSAKRLYPKRLPPPTGDSASEPVSLVEPPALSTEFEKPKPQQQPPQVQSPAPVKDTSPSTPPPPKSPAPLGASTFDFKEAVKSPWKFNREAPRLSLDSRAITDAKGGLRPREIRINTSSRNATDDEEGENNQRRSPSVIARLMGLEPALSSAEPVEKKAELRRSASESRSRDYDRFFDTPGFLSPARNEAVERKLDHQSGGMYRQQQINNVSGVKCKSTNNINNVKLMRNHNHQQQSQGKLMVERRRYHDTADFFPQKENQHQQHQAVTIYGEIERRLRMRGIDEPSKDLDTLKHILEALQLKGLLHSSSSTAPATAVTARTGRNVVYDRRHEESPIVLMKPGIRQRNTNNTVSPRRERPARSPLRSPRGENRSSSPGLRRKCGPLSVETQRRGNEMGSSAVRSSQSPVQSPRMMRRCDHTVSGSPRSRRSTVESYEGDSRVQCGPIFAEDEVSTVSGSSFSTSSHTDNERWRVEEHRDGRNLLERCDKLLHSIAELHSNPNSAELQQPSPVSVLDSSFYKEDESSPSPVKKRTIHFKDEAANELEDDMWSPSSSTTQLLKPDNEIDSSDDSEFSYVSEVLRASNYLPDDESLFLLLEKQSSRGFRRDKSKASILRRKLIFDTIIEILDRRRQLPPWKAVTSTGQKPILEQIWSSFRECASVARDEDLFEVIRGVLKKDLARDSINGWGDCAVEMSEAVLDIERLIFKDMIGETIRDLAVVAGKSGGVEAPRRKLVF